MLNLDRFKFGRKESEYISPFSEFIRNASSGERKKVYKRVMREAIEDQRKIMDLSEES